MTTLSQQATTELNLSKSSEQHLYHGKSLTTLFKLWTREVSISLNIFIFKKPVYQNQYPESQLRPSADFLQTGGYRQKQATRETEITSKKHMGST